MSWEEKATYSMMQQLLQKYQAHITEHNLKMLLKWAKCPDLDFIAIFVPEQRVMIQVKLWEAATQDDKIA